MTLRALRVLSGGDPDPTLIDAMSEQGSEAVADEVGRQQLAALERQVRQEMRQRGEH
jgi:hypothetical protein